MFSNIALPSPLLINLILWEFLDKDKHFYERITNVIIQVFGKCNSIVIFENSHCFSLFSRDKYVFQGQQRKNEKDISWYSHRGNFPSAINTKCQCSRLGDGPGDIRSNTRNLYMLLYLDKGTLQMCLFVFFSSRFLFRWGDNPGLLVVLNAINTFL